MKKEDLIKKLENIELPEIELYNHKRVLRMALLDSDYFKKISYFSIFRRLLVFSSPALILSVLVFVNVIQPKLTEAKILNIAKNSPEVQKLMEENNLILDQIKIKDGRAYVLLNSSETKKTSAIGMIKQENIKNESESVGGAIVEINIKNKNITKINPISNDDITPLVNEEKESAKEIVKLEEIVGEIIPEGAEIEKIQPSFPQKARLVDKDDSVQVVPKAENEKRALVHYNLDGKKWVVQVNLDEKKVEEIKYSSDKDDKNKGRDRLIQN